MNLKGNNVEDIVSLVLRGEKKMAIFDAIFDTVPLVCIKDETPTFIPLKSVSVIYNCSGEDISEEDIMDNVVNRIKNRFCNHWTEDSEIYIWLLDCKRFIYKDAKDKRRK